MLLLCITYTQVVAQPSVVEHCHKLAELGWLYRKVSGYIETKKQDPSLGLVVQVSIILSDFL